MDVNSFDIFCLVPADLSHPGIAVAATRAGAIGVLDLEHASDAQRVEDNFDRLLAGTRGRIGLRLTPQSLGTGRRLIERAGERELVVMLVDADRDRFESLSAGAHSLFAEIRSPDDIAALGFEPDAYVAKGHEAGGWVGDDTAYILAQKLLGKVQRPVHVRGGIGLHSAAGLRIAGAAGVVLDDQLLLLDESALSDRVKLELARLNGSETRLFGELANAPCRVYARPGSESLKAIEARSRDAESGELAIEAWHGEVRSQLGWGADQLLPLGQGIGVAAIYRERYKRVGKLVQAMRSASEQFIETANRLEHLSPGAPLAVSHGTRFPIAQGPMTRVSDSPEFAVDVARGGALPFLALALMRGPQVREMLESTRRQIGDQPWGVGMLGFVPQTLRDEQCEAIWACKPSYALIAGGRPDQAAQFESRGIPTYIHAPAPALLKMYIEQGARRFVFEGRECGGHIGPIASFPLWEQMIEMLLAQARPGSEGEFHLLFAGGIHDARSGAMIAAMTAPLAARGFKVGMLMGTAYLFTPEIVRSGAVVEGFQTQAIACRRTMSLETGPGHSTRCVDSQFAHEFYAQRRQLLREGKSADEIRDELEDLNMGRLRIASKGVNRDASGTIVDVAADQQLSDGMYMIGQVATLRDAALPIEDLHLEVSDGAAALMANWTIRRDDASDVAAPSNVAIVGIGTLLPQALAADAYWNNILRQNCVLREVPKERWDWQLYFDADRTARDKVYSKWGGFLDELPFDPMIYGIPPRSMKSIDPMQLLTLEVSRRALADAGFADGGFDRENTSIILGTSGGLGDLGTQYALRAELPRFVEDLSEDVWDRLPEWTEESFAGSLLNVVAGRVANRLDFGGVNFTVDAACASSLAAISMGVNELETGRSNVVVAGGIDTVQSAFGFLCFSKTQALSPDGQPRTFDQAANGIAISEGLAVIVMKRLEDAERDGDRVYAVIKAAAGSSDGKALGMTAPRPEGQMRALTRAYAKAGFSQSTISMAEAHGTGTPVGDRAEARTITESLQAQGAAAKSVAIGSVKTLLGHTKASAGVAGLIKVAMSLYHRTLPAHYGVDKPIDIIADPDSPVYLLKSPRPWIADSRHPRRGGVSAFGFGGTNFHAVLEEYRDGYAQPDVPGAQSWPYELFVFRAADEAGLGQQLKQVQTLLATDRQLGFSSFAASLVRDAQTRPAAPCVAAFAARDYDGLAADITTLAAHLESGKPLPTHIKFARAAPASAPKIGLLFPGQGAQYVNMGCEPAIYLEELRAAVELADGELAQILPQGLSRLMWPESAFTPEAETAQQQRLTQTQHAQPALGAMELGYLWLSRRLGLQPSAAAGHSYGEYAALMAAGVIDPKTFLSLSAIRGRAMAQASADGIAGGMAAVQADRGVVEKHIAAFDGVRVANHNSPQQSVISGPAEQIDAAVKALTAADIRATRLPVSGAFHTELVASAQVPLSAAIAGAHFAAPEFPAYSNTLGARYPDDASKARGLLDRHLLSSVEFVAEIEAMYEDGIRLFVELGPKSICSNMAMATLAGKDARAVSLDGQGGGLRGLLSGIAELIVAGAELDALALYEPRGLLTHAVAKLAQAMTAPTPSKTTWMLSGGCARAYNDPEIRTGKRPALTLESRDAARAQRRATQAPPTAPVAPAAGPAPLAAAAAGAPISGDAMAAYQETMRQFLALQERVIGQYLGAAAAPAVGEGSGLRREALAPAAPVPAPVAPAVSAPEPVVPSATASGTRDPGPGTAESVDYAAMLLAIVAERTGYPEDMLGLDSDLEADLGIDSIKRVEIAGALQKQLPADVGTQMQAGMEAFTRAKTLNAIIAALDALAPTVPVAAVTPVASRLMPAADAIAEVPRYVIRPQSVPFIAERCTLSGLVLVCGGDEATRKPLIDALVAQGAAVQTVDAIEPDAIAMSLAAARERHGSVCGVVHLYGMEPLASDAFADWRGAAQRSVMSLFHLVQALGSELSGIRLVTATRLGGTLGRTAVGDGAVPGGGVAGLIKCLRHEYPEGRFRLVDFNGQTSATIAHYLADELLANDTLPEVGYTGDARYATTTVEDALLENAFAPRLSPSGDWVVLATGGARGITAELLEEIAQPGMRIVLVGRSPEPPAEEARFAEAADATALRQRLIEDARASGQALKPVELERQLSRLLAAREIRGNLLRLAARGATVDYQACDVRDVQAFGGLIDSVYDRYGRIDAVLHGAGVIEDKLLADKTVESFDRVFGTKIDSAWTLKHKLRPESLKLLVFFSSVAGRYGNQGQSDYACANEAMNRLAWQLSREWTEARVIAANWGPWDAGMASEGVKRQFRARGMEPIPLAGGRRYFVNELAYGPKNEVEVVIGQGPWQQIDGIAPHPNAPAAGTPPRAMPLVRQSLRMGGGGALVLPHHFTAESDPYLDDHIINGKRVLPAAGAAEWMAQVAVEGWPGWQLAEVRDLRVLAGVVLENDKGREVSIRARASTHSGSGEQMISVDIVEAGRKAPLYRASVRLVERLDETPPPVPEAIQGEPLDAAAVYRDVLFHTGRFRLMTTIDAFGETGVDAVVRSSTPQDWTGVEGQWLLDPGLIDVAAQLAFTWVRKARATSALPARFGRLVRYGKAPLPATLKVRFRLRPPSHELAVAFDAYFIDASGDLRLAVLDSESTLSSALNRVIGHS